MNFDDVRWIDPTRRARVAGMKIRVGKNGVAVSRELSAVISGQTFRIGTRRQDGKLVVFVQPTTEKGHRAGANRAGAYLGTRALADTLRAEGAHDRWTTVQVMRVAGGAVTSVRIEYDLPEPTAKGGDAR